MHKVTLLLFTLLSSICSYSQATLFTETFEDKPSPWTMAGDLSPNEWIMGNCAGNGSSFPGDTAAYITELGSLVCVNSDHAYTNAPAAAVHEVVYHTTVDASCASALQVNFDFRIQGVSSEDFGELVYSTDGGSSWISASGELPQSAAWTTTLVGLPGALDGTSFELGFRFTYNDATITGVPFAVDNIVVSGTDVVDPVLTCIKDTVYTDASCIARCPDYTTFSHMVFDNCTDSVDIVITQDVVVNSAFASGPGGTEIVNLTATDESGNSSMCALTVTVWDNIPPVVSCPADTSLYLDANCDGIVPDYTSFAAAIDNCNVAVNIVYTQSPTPGTIINGTGVNVITITATDEFNNSASCNFNMTAVDTMLTQITCPADSFIYVGNNCDLILPDFTGDAILVDNCEFIANLTVTQSPLAGLTVASHQTITLTVTGGVPAVPQACTFEAYLVDTITPGIVCPGGTTLYADNSCLAALPDFTGSAVVNDNCLFGLNVTQSPVPGNNVGLGNNIITLTVADTAGNTSTCNFVVDVIDTISPTITCPGNQTEDADAICSALLGDYGSLATVNDNCSAIGNLTITQLPASGTGFSSATTVTLTVTDENSNSSSCQVDVDVLDVTAPTASCPGNQTVSTNSGCDYILADFTSSTSAIDNCSAPAAIMYSQNPTAGTLLSVGTHTITITATDQAGNVGDCTFNITVEDQVGPTFDVCPSTQQVIADTNCEGILGDYTSVATVSDNCSAPGAITITQSPLPGILVTQDTFVTLTATDALGNSSTCQFFASLSDTISPSVTCPSDTSITIDANCQYLVPDYSALISRADNCSAFNDMIVTQNPSIGSTQSGTTTMIMTLTDQGGNNAICTFDVLPIDTIPPTITCPSPAPIDNGVSCDYLLGYYGSQALVLDNCTSYSIDQSPLQNMTVNTGSHDITLTVTDAGGNSASCTFTLDIFENQTPTITCPSDVTTCDSVITYTPPVYNDNCAVSLIQTDGTGLSSGSVFPIGVTQLEYTAVDSSGNFGTCTFDIEVLEYPSIANIVDDTVWVCGSTSAIISADPVTSGTGEWTIISGQGSFNNEFANATAVNNLGYQTNVFEWTISTTSCGSTSDTVVVITSANPTQGSIPLDTMYTCEDAMVSLQANPPIIGTGFWSTTSAIIDDPLNNVTDATMSVNGWNTFIWTVSNGSCPNTFDSVAVLYLGGNNPSASDSLVCIEDGTVYLDAGSIFDNEEAIWYLVNGSATIDDPYSAQTSASNLQNGLNSFVYQTDHNWCPVITDTVDVIGTLCTDFDPIFPTVITPNYDGQNDYFEIQYLQWVYPECHVTIVNRWGSVVFESVGYEDPWDGRHKDNPLPAGTYFYKIELNDEFGTVFKGDISIIH